jgi:hypothetical protein
MFAVDVALEWPAWVQAGSAVATVIFAWRLHHVTKQQAETAREQNLIAERQLHLEQQRDRLEHTRLTSLATRQALDLSNQLGVVARELEPGIPIGMAQDFYVSKGHACHVASDAMLRFHETLAQRDGKPTVEADKALAELAQAANNLLRFGPEWERLTADRTGNSRRTVAFDAHMHLRYAIVHLCRSVEPTIPLPPGIPPQTAL